MRVRVRVRVLTRSDMNKVYGFEGEVKAKFGEMTYKLFADVFTSCECCSTFLPWPQDSPAPTESQRSVQCFATSGLISTAVLKLIVPLMTVVSADLAPSNLKSEGSQPAILSAEGRKRYAICHGGPPVSKDGVTLEEIAKIDRFGRQPGQEGLMCELLWTDPQDQPGRGPSKRGVGLGFGPDVTRRWCELNKITAVIRSHEVRADGYAIEHDGLCITTFSCPNYCDSQGNKAAYVKMQADGQLSYHQFEAVPHPDVKPMAYSSGFGFMGM
jgi:serine/threonine-protein phosphatase 5